MAFRKLKRIELIGFKSFAEKTTINFHEGITAIVGPNGCGKSNTADAFRWVLGEQSAKSMRGNKMQDVIFTGTDKRKPLNFAEVSITFCNEDGSLPIDYAEVCVTRRLYRSGESEYFINRRPARLKDIVSLLIGTGIGRDSFAIFEQGKIDQVIQLSPTERRGIFEEAAGITRFLMEKKTALKKLEKTELNISRVQDICHEVEKQVEQLEKQAVQAREYKDKKNELQDLDQGILVMKCEKFQEKVAKAIEREAALKEELSQSESSMEGWHQELAKAKDELEHLESQQKEKREKLFKVRSDKEIKAQEGQNYSKRIQEEQRREQELKRQKEELIAKRGTFKEQIAQGLVRQQELQDEISAIEKQVQEQRKHTEKLENEVAELREKQSETHKNRLQFIQDESRSESAMKQSKVRLEHTQERIEQHNQKIERLNQSIVELKATVEEKQQALGTSNDAIEAKKVQLKKLEEQIASIRETIQEKQKQTDSLRSEIAEARARQKVLNRLRDEMEGFSASTKALLSESKKPNSPFHAGIHPLYEMITVSEGDTGSAVAIRSYSQTLAVKTKQVLQAVLQFAKEKGFKDFSLVCIEEFQGKELDHFTKNLKVVESLDEALKVATGADIWSNSGEFIDRNGVIFCPSFGESNVFVREAELKTLNKHLAKLEKSLEEAEAVLKENKAKRIETEEAQRTLDREVRQDEMKRVEVNFAYQRAQGDLEKGQKEIEQLTQELAQLQENVTELNQAVEEAQKAYEEAKKRAVEAHQANIASEGELEQSLFTLKSQQKHQKAQEMEYQQLLEKQQQVTYNLNIAQMRDEESHQNEEKLIKEIVTCQELQEQFQKQEAECVEKLLEVDGSLAQLAEESQQADEKTAAHKKMIEEIETGADPIRDQVKKIEQQLYQAGMEKEQNQQLSDQALEDLRERYQLSMKDARDLEISLEISLTEAEKRLRTIQRHIEAMGDVNMGAIEESNQHKERHAYLTKQLDDLLISKDELVGVINELDAESRKLFQETFDIVRSNFQKNFAILFRGGEADLKFTESLDVLDAGIEITAKPPGKQMRSISLLSGGEKCLTALALLFAIFEVKSAPFCILDEIDAPLDDSNIDRFVNVVQQFIDRCQFIIITHNKRTMAIADSIYGVSMEERGVSRLLSMEFDRESIVQTV